MFTTATAWANSNNSATTRPVHLSVQLHVSLLGLADEHRVRHAVLANPSVDSLDPQPAEVPLLVLHNYKHAWEEVVAKGGGGGGNSVE